MTPDLDVAIVGAGAAGLATAIFAKRRHPQSRVALLEGAKTPGAKILVSGGSRCNVTNTVVTEADFNGGRPATIRRVLRALPVADTVAFFREIGVPLHEEPGGKLFPDSNRSRDVLTALLRESARAGAELRTGCRVVSLRKESGGFQVATSQGALIARRIVLATGGLSLPKTGSDGWGYTAARGLGHTLVPTTPALAPMILDAASPRAIHGALSGVALGVRLDLRIGGQSRQTVAGSLLWTHFGISGPAALDLSRHWLRARLDGHEVAVSANLRPQDDFTSMEGRWLALAQSRARMSLQTALAGLVPASVAAELLQRLEIDGAQTLAAVTRDTRRALTHAVLGWPLSILDSRGYNYAEVTAGGVPLNEIDPGSMQSRVCPDLYLVGEILDVDGRLGGFNFQWAWCTARIAGEAAG